MPRFFYLIFILCLFSACKKEHTTLIKTSTSASNFIVPKAEPTGDEKYLNVNSDYIFDQEKLHTFELWLPVASLAQLDADPTAEEYVEGTLVFEGDTISPVGIRYKGSLGAWVGCLSGGNLFNPSGAKTCTKLSMKIKINWAGANTQFYGLKKLQFHSMNNDPSQMHERLGYWLYRSMGVPTARCVHARLMVNGSYSGLYALTEQIDGRFTDYNFADGDGNLYKEIWPLKDNGQPHSEQAYLAALETNTDKNPTATLLRCFADDVAKSDDSELQSVLASRMDMDEIISYAVVDRMIKNDDGAFHWYCNIGGCAPHNFFWYSEPNNNKHHLIPWDLDHAFANINSTANPVTPIKDGWGEISNNCQPFAFGWLFIQQRSAACDKFVKGWAQDMAKYEQIKDEFKAGPFSKANTDTLLDAWAAQIRIATEEASQAHLDAITVAEWENELDILKAKLEFARNE